jgi:hypothetical protein
MMITRAKARESVEDYIKQNGTYTHNLISMVLRQVAKRYGVEEANKIVREYSLFEKFHISEKSTEEKPPHRRYLGPKACDLEKSLRGVKR